MTGHTATSTGKQSCEDLNKFVVLCTPRTGSYHLTSLLNSAPDIVCHGELFKGKRIELTPEYNARLTTPWTTEQRDQRPWVFLRDVMALDDRPVFGFKMFNEHIWRVARMQLVLTADDWKKVALIRDPLEVYASWLRARKTRQWVKFKGADTGHKSEPTVQFTKDTFLKFKKFYLPFIGRALQNRDQPNWMIVRYDDLDDVAILQSVLDFVGSAARASELTSHYEKQFTRPVSDAFENWESLVEHLKRDDEMQGIDWSGTLKLTEWIRTSGAALARSMG